MSHTTCLECWIICQLFDSGWLSCPADTIQNLPQDLAGSLAYSNSLKQACVPGSSLALTRSGHCSAAAGAAGQLRSPEWLPLGTRMTHQRMRLKSSIAISENGKVSRLPSKRKTGSMIGQLHCPKTAPCLTHRSFQGKSLTDSFRALNLSSPARRPAFEVQGTY